MTRAHTHTHTHAHTRMMSWGADLACRKRPGYVFREEACCVRLCLKDRGGEENAKCVCVSVCVLRDSIFCVCVCVCVLCVPGRSLSLKTSLQRQKYLCVCVCWSDHSAKTVKPLLSPMMHFSQENLTSSGTASVHTHTHTHTYTHTHQPPL